MAVNTNTQNNTTQNQSGFVTENIKQNLQQNAKEGVKEYTRKKDSVLYEVVPVSKDNKTALREICSLQDNLMADYSEWAKESVKYDALSDSETQANLRQSSDNYTMQMFMNCFTGLQRGITVSSVLSTMFTYNMTKILNPNFSQDVSRMYMNLREQIIPALEDQANTSSVFHVASKFAIGKVLKWDAKNFTPAAAQATHNTMVTALRNNTLDDMVMTPRQVAVLKVNFMEQYYSDLRSCDRTDKSVSSEYMQHKRDYEVALQHLDCIARNSGFDMTVVAEEERYIVGMKIMDNPRYGIMFDETFDINNIEPVLDIDGSWNGRFQTRDGHNFTVGSDGNELTGTFTVREPKATLDGKDGYDALIKGAADNYAQVDAYVNHNGYFESAGVDSKVLKKVRSDWDEYQSDYRDRMVAILVDDLGMSKKAAENHFDEVFNTQVQATQSDLDIKQDGFVREFDYAIDKDICGQLNVALPNYEQKDVPSVRLAKTKAFAASILKKNNEINPGDTRNAYDVMETLRSNYVKTMSSDDLFNLIVRADTNLQQGKSKSRDSRFSAFCASDDYKLRELNYDKIKNDLARSGIDLENPSNQDDAEFNL